MINYISFSCKQCLIFMLGVRQLNLLLHMSVSTFSNAPMCICVCVFPNKIKALINESIFLLFFQPRLYFIHLFAERAGLL